MGKIRWPTGSISNQITLAMWLVFVPMMAITAAVVSRISAEQLLKQQLDELRLESILIESKLTSWYQANDERLNHLRLINNLQSLDKDQITRLLNKAIPKGSAASLALIDPDGQVIASTKSTRQGPDSAENLSNRRLAIQQVLNKNQNLGTSKQLRGNWSVEALRNRVTGDVNITLPIGAASLNRQEKGNGTPAAFLFYTIPAKALTREAGIDRLEEVISFGVVSGKALDSKDRLISRLPSFVITKTNGDLLLAFGPSGKVLNTKKLASSSAWQQIATIVKTPCTSESTNQQGVCQAELNYQGDHHIVNYQHNAGGWVLVNTISKTIAARDSQDLARKILGTEFIILLIGTALMRVSARKMADPIEEASRSITQLSSGNFNINLSLKPSGEIGALYDNIRTTSTRLKELVATEKIAAVSIEQMQTAKSIQKNFLPIQHSTTEQLTLAALCEPALEVGADWYDIIPVANGTVLVLADVCDKGVGSALFMSVFRSLVRFFVQQTMATDLSPEQATAHTPEDKLTQVITRVNGYMVENHGSASMFATIFLALHQPDKQQLVVINAGHESSLLVADTGQTLHKLAACGPAVGIFAGARYVPQCVPFLPGDWLLLYSDGLPDAVNGDNLRFGHQRTEETFLKAVTAALAEDGQPNCQGVLDEVNSTLKDFCGGSDAFDDLTIMVATALKQPAKARDT